MPSELPGWIIQRNDLFEELWKEYKQELHARDKPEVTVEILQDNQEPLNLQAKAWETTPAHLLKHVDKALSAQVVVAKIEGELWDLDRPIEKACKIEYVPFSVTEGRMVFWHSSAHVLGESCECHYHAQLSHGPPVEEGFFYDMRIGEGESVKETDLPPIQEGANRVMKEKQPFDRLFVSKKNLEKMFGYSKYKLHYINALLPEEGSTVYRCGTLVDLCRGPHIQNTNKIKAFKIMKNSSCYFLGDKEGDSLQRIYGVAFPDKKLLAEHLKFLEEAAKRDHRRIGVQQALFSFDEASPGSPFFEWHGNRIFLAIQTFLREQYFIRGYNEVQTPNMYDADLWRTSGHWDFYSDDMFHFEIEKRTWALKPMNCPGHCKLFASREWSYRELPLRIADFGVLHRNEASGALQGLTRVRKFQQDDAHIFCTLDQVTSEIEGYFDFLNHVYTTFDMKFALKLSTRPQKYLGTVELWDTAEARLTEALNNYQARTGAKWELNPEDGAFYGPKIDIEVFDALNRGFQCATLQLDFNLPTRFGLEYMTGEAPPKAKDDGEADKPAAKPKAPKKTKEEKEAAKKAAQEAAQQKPDGESSKAVAEASESSAKKLAPEEVAVQTEGKSKPDPPAKKEFVWKEKPLTAGRARPIMLHRAIVGSFERFLAIITEHFAGRWPFWLSPRQVLVVPVMPALNDYVAEVQAQLRAKQIYADIDISGNTMPKKILLGQQKLYNFIFVVGQQEKESGTVNIRNRDDQKTQAKGELIPLDVAIDQLVKLRNERRLVNEIDTKATLAGNDQAQALKQAGEKLKELEAKLGKEDSSIADVIALLEKAKVSS